MQDVIYLKYIGAGSWLPDVPMRDLTKAEVEYHGKGRLLDSHLYELVEEEIKKEQSLENLYEVIIDKETENENKVEKPPKRRGK
jgi:hypothetical protein